MFLAMFVRPSVRLSVTVNLKDHLLHFSEFLAHFFTIKLKNYQADFPRKTHNGGVLDQVRVKKGQNGKNGQNDTFRQQLLFHYYLALKLGKSYN